MSEEGHDVMIQNINNPDPKLLEFASNYCKALMEYHVKLTKEEVQIMGESVASVLHESGKQLFEVLLSLCAEKYESALADYNFWSDHSSLDIWPFLYKCWDHGVFISGYTPEFPVDVLPDPFRRIIRETNRCLNYSKDIIAGSILCAASVAVGNSLSIKIKEGWIEHPILFLAIIGRSGTNKSAPLRFAFRIFQKRDNESYKEFKKLLKEYENNKDNNDRGDRPSFVQTIYVDFTTEALTKGLTMNPRGILVYVDELMMLFENMFRYRKGGDVQLYLSMFNGQSISATRISSDPVNVPNPFLSIIGTIQPDIFRKFATFENVSMGLIDRFLIVYPELKSTKWNDQEINKDILKDWEFMINKLLSIPYDPQTGGVTMEFSPDAKEAITEWQSEVTDQMNAISDDAFSGIMAKLQIYCIRFSLLLEALKYSCNDRDLSEVSLDSVNGAIKLVNYFLLMAFKAIGNNQESTIDSEIKQKIYDALPEKFSTGEAHQILSEMSTDEMGHRTLSSFLKDPKVFKKIKHGVYVKLSV